jgi:hypothetical protein
MTWWSALLAELLEYDVFTVAWQLGTEPGHGAVPIQLGFEESQINGQRRGGQNR